jgi:hypothetical protein
MSPSVQLNFSHDFGNKIYIAKQQNRLTVEAELAEWEPCWVSSTGIGTYPPKPPPLVELQRNPPGLRFFLHRSMLRSNMVAIEASDCQFFNQPKSGWLQGTIAWAAGGAARSRVAVGFRGRKSRLLYSAAGLPGFENFVFD